MTLGKLLDFIKKNNISLDSEIIVRIDVLRKDHDNWLRFTECDTVFTEKDCRDNPRIVLLGSIFD